MDIWKVKKKRIIFFFSFFENTCSPKFHFSPFFFFLKPFYNETFQSSTSTDSIDYLLKMEKETEVVDENNQDYLFAKRLHQEINFGKK